MTKRRWSDRERLLLALMEYAGADDDCLARAVGRTRKAIEVDRNVRRASMSRAMGKAPRSGPSAPACGCGRIWTDDEKKVVYRTLRSGGSVEEAAMKVGRTPQAIESARYTIGSIGKARGW